MSTDRASLERSIAFEVLYSAMYQGKKLDQALLRHKDSNVKFNQVYNLTMGVARAHYQLEAYIRSKAKSLEPQVLLILELATYELFYNASAKPYAVISEALKLTESFKLFKYKKLVHGVLSAVSKDQEAGLDISEEYPPFPVWMMEEIAAVFPNAKGKVMDQLTSQAPFFLTVNTLKISVEDLHKSFLEQGIKAEPEEKDGVRTIRTFDKKILMSKEFREGFFTIQDLSSQIAVKMLEPFKGMKMLDLCSAPGGKAIAAAILAEDDCDIHSIDKSSARLLRFHENLNRMKLKSIKIINGDVMELNEEEGGFDIVMLDPPCSALGVSARNPDTIWSKDKAGIKKLSELQLELLLKAMKYTKKGGKLLYSVCTFTRVETIGVINSALEKNAQYKKVVEHITMPGEMDGLFITILERI